MFEYQFITDPDFDKKGIKPRKRSHDFTKFNIPGNIEELQEWSKKRGYRGFIYGEILFELELAKDGRTVWTDEDVRGYCESWLRGGKLHKEIRNDADEVRREKSNHEFRQKLIRWIGQIKEESDQAEYRRFFGLK